MLRCWSVSVCHGWGSFGESVGEDGASTLTGHAFNIADNIALHRVRTGLFAPGWGASIASCR